LNVDYAVFDILWPFITLTVTLLQITKVKVKSVMMGRWNCEILCGFFLKHAEARGIFMDSFF